MANVKITALNHQVGFVDDDLFLVVDISEDETKKFSYANYVSIAGNVHVVSSNTTAVETRRAANNTIFSNEDTAIQARIAANTLVSASNDFVTYTRLNANVDVVQDNVASNATDITALEARRVANIAGAISSVVTSDLTASRAMVSDGSGKISILSGVTSTELGYVDATSSIQTQLDAHSTEDTALQSRLSSNVTSLTNEDTALQARIAANTLVAASNDFVTYTRLNANVDVVQDNVASNATDITALEARRVANIAGAISSVTTSDLTASRAVASDGSGKLTVSAITATELGYLDGVTSAIQTQLAAHTTEDTALEARRAANIAGAVSTITTGNLTASRALASDGSGKVSASGVTSTILGYLDATSSIQTQLDAKAALAGGTFTGQVNFSDDAVITGNLIVNGDTITANAVNLVVQDQFIAISNVGTVSMDAGIFFNRGTSGNAAIWYDASAYGFYLSETRDPFSNTTVSPTGAANLTVGKLTATGIVIGSADISETELEILDGATLSTTELNYVDGVTSAIQTQLTAHTTEDTALEARRAANIAGAISTVLTSDLTASRAIVVNGSGKIAVSDVTATEISYLDGVTSAIQTQLAAHTTEDTALEARRAANIAGAISTVLTSDLTASRAMVTDGSGKIAVDTGVTATELGYLDATSSIQTQLDAKGSIPSNTMHTTTTTNSYATGSATGNLDELMVFINGTYQNEDQYVLANSTHNVQFKASSFAAGLSLEIRKF